MISYKILFRNYFVFLSTFSISSPLLQKFKFSCCNIKQNEVELNQLCCYNALFYSFTHTLSLCLMHLLCIGSAHCIGSAVSTYFIGIFVIVLGFRIKVIICRLLGLIR